MDQNLVKATLPAIGGVLALLGGIFTFVSGRLRDAADEDAKSHVIGTTWLWVAVLLWFAGAGAGIATLAPTRVLSIPFYAASLAVHWHLYVSSLEPATRKGVATFAAICSLTAFAVCFALFAELLDGINNIQRQQLQLLQDTINAIRGKAP